MITPTALWTASNAVKGRTPIYRVKFAGVAQEYSTQPIKANYLDEVLADGPTGLWICGESSGATAVDSSGNGLTATIVGAPTMGVTGALVGASTTAFRLNGTTQYLSVPNNVLLNPGNTFSIEIIFKMRVNPPVIYSLFNAGVGGYSLVIDPTPILYLQKSSVANMRTTTAAGILSPSTYYHVVATKTGSTDMTIWLNGVDVTDRVTYGDQTVVATASPLLIGQFIDGDIQFAAVYAKPLSALRVRQHYDASQRLLNRRNVSAYIRQDSLGIGASQVIPERGQSSIGALTFVLNDQADEVSEIIADAPIGFYRCGDLSGTVATDSSGNGKNGVYA